MRSIVISICLYACEWCALTAELEKRTKAFEMRCFRRLFNIRYNDHVTSQKVQRKFQAAIGVYDNVVVVVLLFYVHGKHLRSCREGQLT